MKSSTFITTFRQRRARKKYEREKALRAQQGDDAMDRVVEGAKNLGGGANIGGSSSS
jgi:hypothetical protein